MNASSKRRRTRGNEAPIIIWPRDLAKLARQLVSALGRRSRRR